MCNVPVTLGGGRRMQYASPVPDGWNAPLASHRAYYLDSIWAGSKLFSIAMRSVTRKLRAVSWGSG
jgi:hypothetical protein